MTAAIPEDHGYILHGRRFRENSRILEILCRDQGRIALMARVSGKSGARNAALLQPFRETLFRWHGRGELKNMQSFETVQGYTLGGEAGICGLYCNELLLHLLPKGLPAPEVYQAYHATLQRLSDGQPAGPALRAFEWLLLMALGYAADLEEDSLTGQPLAVCSVYYFLPGQGVSARTPGKGSIEISSDALAALRSGDFSAPEHQRIFRQLTAAALQQLLGSRKLKSRELIRNLSKYRREPRRLSENRSRSEGKPY